MAKRDVAIPRAPTLARRWRRWRMWWEAGQLDNGACVLDAGWYAKAPGGDVITAREWNDLLAGIDEIEDALGRHPRPGPTPFVEHNPPRPIGPYEIWRPDPRRKV